MLGAPETDARDAGEGIGVLPEIEVERPFRRRRQDAGPDGQGVGEGQALGTGRHGQAALITSRQGVYGDFDAEPDGLDRPGGHVDGVIAADQVRLPYGFPIESITLATLVVFGIQFVTDDITDERGLQGGGGQEGFPAAQVTRFHTHP